LGERVEGLRGGPGDFFVSAPPPSPTPPPNPRMGAGEAGAFGHAFSGQISWRNCLGLH